MTVYQYLYGLWWLRWAESPMVVKWRWKSKVFGLNTSIHVIFPLHRPFSFSRGPESQDGSRPCLESTGGCNLCYSHGLLPQRNCAVNIYFLWIENAGSLEFRMAGLYGFPLGGVWKQSSCSSKNGMQNTPLVKQNVDKLVVGGPCQFQPRGGRRRSWDFAATDRSWPAAWLGLERSTYMLVFYVCKSWKHTHCFQLRSPVLLWLPGKNFSLENDPLQCKMLIDGQMVIILFVWVFYRWRICWQCSCTGTFQNASSEPRWTSSLDLKFAGPIWNGGSWKGLNMTRTAIFIA